MDAIFRGEEAGGYYLILGPKGTGKGTMVLECVLPLREALTVQCDACYPRRGRLGLRG